MTLTPELGTHASILPRQGMAFEGRIGDGGY